MEIKLYHGSKNRIELPQFGAGKKYNDYGLGFYCTESKVLAAEWAVDVHRDGCVNQYELDFKNLTVLKLNSEEYTILHWITVLLENRTFDIQSDFGLEAMRYLKEKFSVPYREYDVIIGYRADDSYFSFAQDFLNNLISIRTLSRAMRLGKLGEQIVLKSERAFQQLNFTDAEYVRAVEWYPQKETRDRTAREAYREIRSEGYKRGELYMMQLMDLGIGGNDERLRRDIII